MGPGWQLARRRGPPYYKCKEVDTLRKLDIELSLAEPPDKGAAGRHFDVQPCEPLQMTRPKCARLLIHGHSELINVCFSKPPTLWRFATQQ